MKAQFLKKFFCSSLIAVISCTSSALPASGITVDAATKENAVREYESSTVSTETKSFYDYWKEKYLVQDPYVTEDEQYYVFYGEQTYAEAGDLHKDNKIDVFDLCLMKIRTCPHRNCVRIFEHNFDECKEKKRKHTDVW